MDWLLEYLKKQLWTKRKVQFKVQKLHFEILKETYQITRHQFKPDISRGDCLLADAKSHCLSGLRGFLEEYVPVFLAGKNVYRTQNFKRG